MTVKGNRNQLRRIKKLITVWCLLLARSLPIVRFILSWSYENDSSVKNCAYSSLCNHST